MVSIILVVLFICQLLSFFFIILLNSRLAKFKDLEIRQERIVKEMDDAIGLYLMEMKEENDRLIKELTTSKQTFIEKQQFAESKEPDQWTEESAVSPASETLDDLQTTQQKPYVPLAFAANVYSKQKQQISAEEQQVEQVPKDYMPAQEQGELSRLAPFEREVVEMHRAGKTIEEIAKKTQKGKTEIELLIKFHA